MWKAGTGLIIATSRLYDGDDDKTVGFNSSIRNTARMIPRHLDPTVHPGERGGGRHGV
jgi:hypothetical protein